MTTQAEMTFKCQSGSPNVAPIESSYIYDFIYELLLLMVYSNFRRTSLTVSEIQTVLMLKTTFLPTPFVFDIEFEGHAVGMWRENFAPEN